MKIEWIISGARNSLVEEDDFKGGYIYENYLRKILQDEHELEVVYLNRGNHSSKIFRALQFCRYLLKSMSMKFRGEMVIRDVFSTAFAPFDRRRKNLVILHHLDISNVKHRFLYKILKKRFYRRAKFADKVVAVSKHWKKNLEKSGCSNIQVIYNSFDLDMFDFDFQELSDFRDKLGIVKGKNIIYLGNARQEKGYRESYDALKDLDVVFVTTGKDKANIPVLQYYLSYQDYLRLIKLSTLTVTMSKFDEGWCRTAHESMLCGTPVVGSGKGGMLELLEGGGQIVCSDFKKLRSVVVDLINDTEKLHDLSERGKKFASQFSLEYFKESWLDLMSSLYVP